ncbi:AAA-associated domain-containing protein [Microbacterium ginsengisoli]|uniref:AAA-associated domain-containing protein n=1 Tax=Microbacterium ginsengisoli TaxID=400772 RepID=UPI001B805C3A|nr:AAA-associated domain-containing protein [Microbacterium ginsengisoli]
MPLPRPRDRRHPLFAQTVDRLYALLTGTGPGAPGTAAAPVAATPLSAPLPDVSVGGLAGLVEIVHSHNGQTDLPDLADELSFEVDDLLPLVDAAALLGFIEVDGAQLFLTEDGRAWGRADIQESKKLFARLSAAHAPLVRTILTALENSDDGALRDDFFLDLLRRGFSGADARVQLDIAIQWGRYAELFDYDADSGELVLGEVAAAFGV